jgi:hypothetical protein
VQAFTNLHRGGPVFPNSLFFTRRWVFDIS